MSESSDHCQKCGKPLETHPKSWTCEECRNTDAKPRLTAPVEPRPDALSQLHTLRSLANAVKQQLDAMKLYSISWRVAAISEQATETIEHLNAVTPTPEAQRDCMCNGYCPACATPAKDEQQDSRGPG